LEFEEVKVEYKHPTRLLQSILILKWKWEVISMDFIMRIFKISRKHDAIIVVVDKLSKETHFIFVNSTHKAIGIAHIFMKEIFRLHGVPKHIISNIYSNFT